MAPATQCADNQSRVSRDRRAAESGYEFPSSNVDCHLTLQLGVTSRAINGTIPRLNPKVAIYFTLRGRPNSKATSQSSECLRMSAMGQKRRGQPRPHLHSLPVRLQERSSLCRRDDAVDAAESPRSEINALSPQSRAISYARLDRLSYPSPEGGGWPRRPSAAVLSIKNADAKRRLCERSEAGRVGVPPPRLASLADPPPLRGGGISRAYAIALPRNRGPNGER